MIRLTPYSVKLQHLQRIAKLKADINLPAYYFDDMFFEDYLEYLKQNKKWQH